MLNNAVNEAWFVKKFREIIAVIYNNWWAERNGGNISYLLDDDMLKPFLNATPPNRIVKMSFVCQELANAYFLVTGSSKFYRNIANPLETINNAGIIQIDQTGENYYILWGLENDAVATSELPTHLLTHAARLKVNPAHRVVIHSHPTNLIALTFIEKLNEHEFTKKMWEMISEASVVFPEGIGLIPWMLPGSNEIGLETAKKMKTYRSVIWPHHGVFCSGESLDQTLGLLECIEKSAMIYLKILQTNKPILQKIESQGFKEMENFFGFKLNDEVLK